MEVSFIGSSDISDFGESEDETVNDDANVPNVLQGISWTNDFRGVIIDPFEQDSGPNLPCDL